MYLKRLYKDGKPVCVKVLRAPVVQKISTHWVEEQVDAGLIVIADGKITIRTADGQPDLVYRIVTGPGRYCCHCNEKLSKNDRACVRHVKEKHPGVESPDPNNPAGFRQDNCYTCVLDSETLTAVEAEQLVQKQRREAIAKYGDKHKTAVARAVGAKKNKLAAKATS